MGVERGTFGPAADERPVAPLRESPRRADGLARADEGHARDVVVLRSAGQAAGRARQPAVVDLARRREAEERPAGQCDPREADRPPCGIRACSHAEVDQADGGAAAHLRDGTSALHDACADRRGAVDGVVECVVYIEAEKESGRDGAPCCLVVLRKRLDEDLGVREGPREQFPPCAELDRHHGAGRHAATWRGRRQRRRDEGDVASSRGLQHGGAVPTLAEVGRPFAPAPGTVPHRERLEDDGRVVGAPAVGAAATDARLLC
ncbi:MAG: hypothetical protein U0S48_10630 [Solirubrobacteraceae bacterium]